MADEMTNKEKEMNKEYKEATKKKPGKVITFLKAAGPWAAAATVTGLTGFMVSKGSAKGSASVINALQMQVDMLRTQNQGLADDLKTAKNTIDSLKGMIRPAGMSDMTEAVKEATEEVKSFF